MGHFFRCYSIAKQIYSQYDLIFIVDNESIIPPKIDVEKYSIKIIQLPELTSIENEHAFLKQNYNFIKLKLVITDLCTNLIIKKNKEFLEKYHTSFKKYFQTTILSFEDYRLKNFTSDYVVIWNTDRKDNSSNHSGKILCGFKYFVCNKSITFLSKQKRSINKIGKRLLIFYSGSSENNPTSEILKFFVKRGLGELELRVIFPSHLSKTGWKNLEKISCKNSKLISLININNNIGEHLLWCDLAIIGDGLIKYDAAILGTPVIKISLTGMLGEDSDVYKNWNCGIVFDSLDIPLLYVKAISLLNDFETRYLFSENAKKKIDGLGFKRIFIDELGILKNV